MAALAQCAPSLETTMELRHLRYFIAAAEEQHFGRASEKLHVTRPAVSKIVADLEEELGLLLFERQGHKVSLTPAGRKLLPDMKAVMLMLTEAFAAAKKICEGKSGNLSVGYGTLTLHNQLFRASIKKFKEANPDVSLTLLEIPTQDQPKALAEGRIHVGFMHFGALESGPQRKKRPSLLPIEDESVLDWEFIEKGHLGVVMERTHRLAREKELSLADLAGERFVVAPKSTASPGYGMLYSLCQQAGYEPKVVQEVNSISTMLNLVSVGVGIALCVIGKNFVYPSQIRVVPLRQVAYSTSFVVGWLKGRQDPLIEALLGAVRFVSGRK
jgi:DNA-binding transcriptional LysR family regulator